MEDKLIYSDLCSALSDIFVDNEVDYKFISSVAVKFSVEKVEYIFFEWVAPVCYSNSLTPTPPVWAGFDKEELWDDICKYRNNRTLFKKVKHHLLVIYLKASFKKEWLTLKSAMLEALS